MTEDVTDNDIHEQKLSRGLKTKKQPRSDRSADGDELNMPVFQASR